MKKRFWLVLLPLLAVFLISQNFSWAQEEEIVLDRPGGIEQLPNGNVLITDEGGRDWSNEGSEVIEIDFQGKIVWSFQNELVFAHSAEQLANGNILITDTTNNRLLEVNRDKKIVWTSDSWPKKKLTDGSFLNYPNDAEELTNGHFLVTDRNRNRVIEIDRSGRIYWQKKDLSKPHNADRLVNGNTLISDSEEDQVIEVNSAGEVVWSYGGGEESPLYWPRDVDKLANGNYLITDSRHHRVIEVTPEGEETWEYSQFLSFPYEAERLTNGNTLISDSYHFRVIEVTPEGEIVWQFRNAPQLKPDSHFAGSFEKDRDGDGWPDEWIRGNLLAEGQGTFGWDENVAKDAQKSIRLDYDGEGMIFWHQYFPVKPGQKYDLIGFIKSQDLDGYARFEVIFLDELGGQIGVTARTPNHKRTTKWTRYETVFSPPKEAVTADIWCLVEGKGTAWFDEISLRQVGWQRVLGLKLSLGIIGGAIIIALILNKIVK